MRLTRGGIGLETALDMDFEDLEEWTEAALELEKRIAQASK